MVKIIDLSDFDRLPGDIYIHKDAKVANNVEVGFGSIIYEDVIIEEECTISEHCIIRPKVKIEKGCQIHGNVEIGYKYKENEHTIIGAESIIRKGTIIYAGNIIAKGFQTGNNAVIRENCSFGEYCSVGTFSQFDGYANVGKYSRFSYGAHVGQHSQIGNYIWIFPYSVLTNDKYPPYNVCPPHQISKGPIIKDFAIIATECILMPGITIGSESMVGAGSVVTKDVPKGELWFGIPARFIKKMEDISWSANFAKQYGISNPYPWKKSLKREGYIID